MARSRGSGLCSPCNQLALKYEEVYLHAYDDLIAARGGID